MTNILLMEDSKISREAIAQRINLSQEFLLIAAIENAANAEIACLGGGIDLILMDVCTADDESGLKAAAKIKKHYPSIKVVIMTSMPEYSFLRKAKEAHCDGFWYKEYGDADVLDICARVMQGEAVWPASVPAIQVGYMTSDEFTPRELDVLHALAQGLSYEEISDVLCISTNTVKYHIKNLLQEPASKNGVSFYHAAGGGCGGS